MEKVLVGKIINTFGIKGELKVAPDFQFPEKVFFLNNKLILNDKEVTITKVRFHKDNYLLELNNINDINKVLKYKGLSLYVLRSNIKLDENQVLYNDLINFDVYDFDNYVGKVTHVYLSDNPLIKVDNKFYIPLKGDFINNIDYKNKRINCIDLKGLMLWK